MSAPTPVHANDATLPSFSVETLDGTPFELAGQRGRWVIVNWWATWCVPCIKELPEIGAVVARHGERVVAIGLAYEDTAAAEVADFLRTHSVRFPVAIIDPAAPPPELRPPPGLPKTYVIDPDGRIAREFIGPVTARDLEAVIATRR